MLLRKKQMVIGGLGLACVLLLLFQWTWPQEVVLPDGATLVLTQAKVGQTNFFRHGTWLEKYVGAHLRKGVFQLGRFTVQRPEVVEESNHRKARPSLSLEFQLLGTNTLSFNELTGASYAACRVMHWGDDGYKYFEEFRPFQARRDGFFGYVTTANYAADSWNIHVQIQHRQTPEGPWIKLAEFKVKNPRRKKVEQWIPESYPASKSVGNVNIELHGVRIRPSMERLPFWQNISEQRIDYLFRVLVDGHAATNWGAHQFEVENSMGDILFQGGAKIVTNEFIMYSGPRSANLSPVWKVKVHFSPDSGFGASNLFQFKVPYPVGGAMTTNFQELNTTISLRENMLAVRIPKTATNSRLLFLSATDESGKSIQEFTAATGQHLFCESLKMEGKSSVNVQMAIVRDIPVEFMVKPVIEGREK